METVINESADLSESSLKKALLAIEQFRKQANLFISAGPYTLIIPGDSSHKKNEYSLLERSYLYWCFCGECRANILLKYTSFRKHPASDANLFRIVTKNGKFPNRWSNRKQFNKWHFIKKNRGEAFKRIKRRKALVKTFNTTPNDDNCGLDGEYY